MIEVNCETDFVARNDEFRQLPRTWPLQVVAANPIYVRREEVPGRRRRRAEADLHGQAADKPENVREKIAEGKLDAWYGENVLLDQKFVKDESQDGPRLIMAVNCPDRREHLGRPVRPVRRRRGDRRPGRT